MQGQGPAGTVCAAALWPGKGGGMVMFTVCECWNGCVVVVGLYVASYG